MKFRFVLGNDWNSARVNIAAENRYRIIFEATVGADYHGDIGLDDVQISPGSCDSPGKYHNLVTRPHIYTSTSLARGH